MKGIAFIVISVSAWLLFSSARHLPVVGNHYSIPATRVSPRYVEKAVEETGADNFVTAILVDYRGLDTLGETTVIFIAGIACFLILLGARRDDEI